MIAALAAIVVVTLALHLIGAAVATMLSDGQDRDFLTQVAPLLGLSVVFALLEVAGFFLPLRIGAWLVLPIVALGSAYALAKRGLSALHLDGFDAIPVVVALAIGLIPLLIAGRATAVSMTNDDGTYYLSAADRLLDLSWLGHAKDGTGEYCLSEDILHGWYWRTGIPNTIAAVSATLRVDTPASLGILTGVFSTLIPRSAVALASLLMDRSLSRRERLVVGVTSSIGASYVFLAFQHLTGHFLATIYFPVACAGTVRAVVRDGIRSKLVAGLLLGGGIAAFADGTPVLILGGLTALVVATPAIRERITRLSTVALATLVLFPGPVYRAAWAAWGTVAVRLPAEQPLFPQRGWLARGPLDDLATMVGVDPWPPWPTARPIDGQAAMTLVAAVAGALLIVLALRTLPRRRSLTVFGALSMILLVGIEWLVPARYVIGKWLLMDAAFAVPVCCLGLATARPRALAQGAGAVWLAGAIAAIVSLSRPSGFHVVDERSHDAMVTELGRLPSGALIVLDGFGAPADVVHDEHRAYRAAQLAHLEVIQPGLDGGFYKPICPDSPRPAPLPARGYALARVTSETLSNGRVVARFGQFVLREVDFAFVDSFLGAWAPTHGWSAAEREPDGTVFRWAEASAAGTLRVVSSAGCARLSGEVRSVRDFGRWELTTRGRLVLAAELTPTWSAFRTPPFATLDELPLEWRVTGFDPPQTDHALAVRNLRVTTDSQCLIAVQRNLRPSDAQALPESLQGSRDYMLTPAAASGCATLEVTVTATTPGSLAVAVGELRVSTAATTGSNVVRLPSLEFATPRLVTVTGSEAEGTPPWTIDSMRLVPVRCEAKHVDGP